ncbi:MAG: DUF2207 domain-containing protein [Dehalococcoidia bacterium]|nr:DUF2207 domain-containing protein [Dehalococcoidia bacterium]
MLALAVGGEQFDGFSGLSLVLLIAAFLSGGGWAGLAVVRWFATRSTLPRAGPETDEPGPEPPAVANFLINHCHVTRVAVSATFVDLAAQRFLAIDMLSLDHGVVRLRQPVETSVLRPYEHQVLDLIRRRATGGSCPLEVLEVEASADDGWFKAFQKGVVKDARRMGLARNRWAALDYVVLGGWLAVVFLLFALSFASANLFVQDTGSSDDWGRWDWLWAGGIAWVVLMVGFGAFRSVRETDEGDRVASRWLGFRNYLRHSEALEGLPPAAVTVWGRNLSGALAVGAAHDTAEALPFRTEDPEAAWTRYSGVWRQVRVEYPRRFGFGQEPWKAALEGLGRAVMFGGMAFIILPIMLPLVFDLRDEFGSDLASGDFAKLKLIVFGVVAFQTALGGWWALLALAGAIRGLRGISDLGRPVVLEGEVVKVHGGRIAVDDGRHDSVTAFFLVPGAGSASRGDHVRVVHTANLWRVRSIEQLPSL